MSKIKNTTYQKYRHTEIFTNRNTLKIIMFSTEKIQIKPKLTQGRT